MNTNTVERTDERADSEPYFDWLDRRSSKLIEEYPGADAYLRNLLEIRPRDDELTERAAWAHMVNKWTRTIYLDGCSSHREDKSWVAEVIPLFQQAYELVEQVPGVDDGNPYHEKGIGQILAKNIKCRMHWLEQYVRGEYPSPAEEICDFSRESRPRLMHLVKQAEEKWIKYFKENPLESEIALKQIATGSN